MTTGARPFPPAEDLTVVLVGRPARDRAPAATVWELLHYDPRTRVPVADIARRWLPLGSTSPGVVTVPVVQWVTDTLGAAATITGPADDLAGPGSWHINTLWRPAASTPGSPDRPGPA